MLAKVDGAIRIPQTEFTSDRLAAEISAFAAEPAHLASMAAAAKGAGRLDAAERLADLVAEVAGIRREKALVLAFQSGASSRKGARLIWPVTFARCRLSGGEVREQSMRLPREIGPVHFVGIGGIGMSGIAEVLVNRL